jgi:hypothetical protein
MSFPPPPPSNVVYPLEHHDSQVSGLGRKASREQNQANQAEMMTPWPLPMNWHESLCPTTGIPYYIHLDHDGRFLESTWDRPPGAPMAKGWIAHPTQPGRCLHEETRIGTYSKPMEPIHGWRTMVDSNEQLYYINDSTGQTTRVRPTTFNTSSRGGRKKYKRFNKKNKTYKKRTQSKRKHTTDCNPLIH